MVARYTFFILLLAVCISGCKKDSESKPVDLMYSYFPLISGHELIYQVVENDIDKDIDLDTIYTYQLKERIDSMFIDNSGNPAWRLERYKRTDSTASWIISDVWIAQIANNKAQQFEENKRFIKIIFPPEIGKIWNGNAYNTLTAQNYEITGLNSPFSLNNLDFDSVLTVTLDNRETAINKYYSEDKYANHVGLIYKKIITIDYADIIYNGQVLLPIEQRISRGSLYYQTLIDK